MCCLDRNAYSAVESCMKDIKSPGAAMLLVSYEYFIREGVVYL